MGDLSFINVWGMDSRPWTMDRGLSFVYIVPLRDCLRAPTHVRATRFGLTHAQTLDPRHYACK
jgi:hypothetical protein